MRAHRRGDEHRGRRGDLLSLEELARSLASLDEGTSTAVDAAARTGALRAQLSRALDEQRGELLELASAAAQARRPSSLAASERFDGIRAQLLDALLRGDGHAASAAAAAAADASRGDGSWALSGPAPEGGGFWPREAARIDVTPHLLGGGGLRGLAPTPKRKHEGSGSPLLACRPKLPAAPEPSPPAASVYTGVPAWPAAQCARAQCDEYDADDDGSEPGCELLDVLPQTAPFLLRPGARPPAPPGPPGHAGGEERGLCEPMVES